MKKIAKNEFFKIFVSFLMGSFFSKLKIFENFYIQPPNFISFTCSKHPKWKLHEGLIVLTSPQMKWQAVKWAQDRFRPLLVRLGLRIKISGGTSNMKYNFVYWSIKGPDIVRSISAGLPSDGGRPSPCFGNDRDHSRVERWGNLMESSQKWRRPQQSCKRRELNGKQQTLTKTKVVLKEEGI